MSDMVEALPADGDCPHIWHTIRPSKKAERCPACNELSLSTYEISLGPWMLGEERTLTAPTLHDLQRFLPDHGTFEASDYWDIAMRDSRWPVLTHGWRVRRVS